MFISVVIPTYNRWPILEKCLKALEDQDLDLTLNQYEVVVVDDGSSDGTPDRIREFSDRFPHLCLFEQEHAGPAEGRNRGVANSRGEIIIFIDSDLVVTRSFLSTHLKTLVKEWKSRGDRLCFTYGAVINTSNFNNPASEPYKLQDISLAYFATGNVAIDKELLKEAGLFDVGFSLYGWEDLELGERLRYMNVKLIKCPQAVGYHWHPPFSLEQIPQLIRVERERAKMGLFFYRKHPTFRVRLMIQFTLMHKVLWEVLTLGGLLNEKSLRPCLAWLIRKGYSGIALELLRLALNRIGVREIYREATLLGLN